MSDLWQRCLARLEGEIEPSVLHTWLQPLQARYDDGTLRLFAPNSYTLEFVRNGYLSRIEGTLSALAGRPVPLRLEVEEKDSKTKKSRFTIQKKDGEYRVFAIEQE